MNPEQTQRNIVADLDSIVTPRTLPYFGGTPWEVSVGTTSIAVTKGQPTLPLDARVTDRADYYLWCGANICIHQPPDTYRGQITGYLASITPNIQGAFRHTPVDVAVDRWVELVRWAPTTAQGATSYESGMSDSINGSIGFFGESPTASVGASVTWSNSQTRSSPDVDIAAYTRSNSATWMFNLNQPSTLAATSSMEIYIQALFRLQGFSPYYLAYLDYSQGTPPTTTESIDPTTGLPPLTAQQYEVWTAALNPQQRETLVSQRAFSYTEANQLSFQIDFQAISQSNILPMAPVTVTCGTPDVDTSNDLWEAFLTKPDATTLPASAAVGQNSTIIGYLVCDDKNYQSGSNDENPNTMFDYQTLRSWNGQYCLTIDKSGALQVSTTWGTKVWNDVSPSATVPEVTSNKVSSSGSATPAPAATASKVGTPAATLKVAATTTLPAPAPAAVAGPYKLEITGSSYTVSNGVTTRTFQFPYVIDEIGNAIAGAIGGVFGGPTPAQPPAKGPQPDAYTYRRLELTGDGTLRLVDSSGTVLWANKTAATGSGVTISSGIFSSLGGAVNGLEAIGSGVLQLGESALGIGSLIPGGGSLASIPGLSSFAGLGDLQGLTGKLGDLTGGLGGLSSDLGGLTGKLGDLTQGILGKLGV